MLHGFLMEDEEKNLNTEHSKDNILQTQIHRRGISLSPEHEIFGLFHIIWSI